MGKQARKEGRAQRARRHTGQTDAATAVRAAWEHAWAEYAKEVREFTVEHLAEQGRKIRDVRVSVDDHHDAREAALTGKAGRDVRWPSYTYLPRGVVGGWLMKAYQWALSRDVLELTLSTAQMGGVLAGFDKAPIVARFDPDLADALMATPISGDLPGALLHQLPAWTVAIPMPWVTPTTIVFAAVDTGWTTFDGVLIDDAGLDQLVLLVVQDDTVFPIAIELGGSPIAEQLVRGAELLAANPFRPGRELLELADAQDRLNLPTDVTGWLERVVALLLYLCSEERDVTAITTPVTTPRVQRRQAATTPIEVLDVGYRVGASLRAATARQSGTNDQDDPAALRRRPAPHLRKAHFHLYWYGPRADPTARLPKVRWLAPIPVNVTGDSASIEVREVRG